MTCQSSATSRAGSAARRRERASLCTLRGPAKRFRKKVSFRSACGWWAGAETETVDFDHCASSATEVDAMSGERSDQDLYRRRGD